MSGFANNEERRRHKRLKVGDRTAAITIANKDYRILEMSSSGFSSECLDGPLSFNEEHPTQILLHGLSLISDVSIQLAWQGNRNHSKDSKDSVNSTPKAGFKFGRLRTSQKLQLEAFLKWHTESAELLL